MCCFRHLSSALAALLDDDAASSIAAMKASARIATATTTSKIVKERVTESIRFFRRPLLPRPRIRDRRAEAFQI
jgi:hypothetical protein